MNLNKNYISIQLNEVNREWLISYAKKNNFVNIKTILSWNGVNTESEKEYSHLEPWIQWPTYYLGKSYKEHKLFHLGDVHQRKKNYSIYDYFQSLGRDVLALAPMNCSFKTNKNSLIIHDPWSNRSVKKGSKLLRQFWEVVCYFINENSNNTFKPKYLVILLISLIRFARFRNYISYIKLLFFSIFFNWSRAIFLDLLLFDVFTYLIKNGNYSYSSLFLNAGAHIQHHYLFDSFLYRNITHGKNKNPLTYSSLFTKFLDPMYQVYKIYDHVIYDLLKLGNTFDIEITTGLQQKINPNPYFQYRIKNYDDFFNSVSLKYIRFEKKMSRDIYIFFEKKDDLDFARETLNKYKIKKQPFFKVYSSKEDLSLFVQVAYRGNISDLKNVEFDNKKINFEKLISLVSIENAIHQSVGWHVNNFHKFNKKKIPLKNLTNELYGFKNK